MALKSPTELQRSRHERGVGKHKTEPRHLKGQPVVRFEVLPQRARRHEKEPYTHSPQPQSHHESHHLEDEHRVRVTQEVGREDVLCPVAQHDDAGYCKRKGTDGDEDAGSLGVAGQFLRHETVEEGGADHEADEEGCSLDADRGEADGYCVEVLELSSVDCCGDESSAEGRSEEERVRWEYPYGCHCMDWEGS